MPSFNDPDAPTPQYVVPDESARYAGQPYYKRECGEQLQNCIRAYIDAGRTGYIWRTHASLSTKSLRVYLNCARAWILDHTDNFHGDVVETLRCSRFRKCPAGIELNEIVDAEGKPTEYVPPNKHSAIPLDQLGGVTDVSSDNLTVVGPDPAVAQTAALAGLGKHMVPTPPPQPPKTMSFLPDDGDLEALQFNMDAYFRDPACPEGAKFERVGIKLTPAEIETIKGWLPGLGVRGLVTPTRILVAKIYTVQPSA